MSVLQHNYLISMYYKHSLTNYEMAMAYIAPVLIKYHNGSLNDTLLSEVKDIVKEVKMKNNIPPKKLITLAKAVISKLANYDIEVKRTIHSIEYRLLPTL